MKRFLLALSVLFAASCAARAPGPGDAAQEPMGTISTLSRAKTADAPFCEHKVPEENCTRHHPELAERFKSVGDWCPEHDLPESQCLICHPELTFDPLPATPADADVKTIAEKGADVPSLEADACSRATGGVAPTSCFVSEVPEPQRVSFIARPQLQGAASPSGCGTSGMLRKGPRHSIPHFKERTVY